MGLAVCDQPSRVLEDWPRSGAIARLTELANKTSLGGARSPLAVGDAALVIDGKAQSLVPLAKLVEAALVLVNKVESLLVASVTVADGGGEGLEPGR